MNVIICLLSLFFILVTVNDIVKTNSVSSEVMTKTEQEFATTMERSYNKQARTIFRRIQEEIEEHEKLDIERYYEELRENFGDSTLKHVWPKVLALKEKFEIKEMTQAYLEHSMKSGETLYWTREKPPQKRKLLPLSL